jgi:hypothetical protein
MEMYQQRLYKRLDFSISTLSYDSEVKAFILEDEKREVKVMHETRIPAGRYEILLNTSGNMNVRYRKKFPFHIGMLHLQNVPNFKFIYIHIGNTDDDTSGCLLVGKSHTLDANFIGLSTPVYTALYLRVMEAFTKKEKVFINISDELVY